MKKKVWFFWVRLSGQVQEVSLTWYLEAGKKQLRGVKFGAAGDKELTVTSLLWKEVAFQVRYLKQLLFGPLKIGNGRNKEWIEISCALLIIVMNSDNQDSSTEGSIG